MFVSLYRLSEALLQGFTCTSVQSLDEEKVKQLVRACRHRPGRKKVQLKESQVARHFTAELDVTHLCVWRVCDCRLVVFQLMCMYNYMKDEDGSSFTDLPAETLLYYRRVAH